MAKETNIGWTDSTWNFIRAINRTTGCLLQSREPNWPLPNVHIGVSVGENRDFFIGGESGSRRRDCGVEVIEDLSLQVIQAGVRLFVKQDCALKPGQQGRISPGTWRFKELPV